MDDEQSESSHFYGSAKKPQPQYETYSISASTNIQWPINTKSQGLKPDFPEHKNEQLFYSQLAIRLVSEWLRIFQQRAWPVSQNQSYPSTPKVKFTYVQVKKRNGR